MDNKKLTDRLTWAINRLEKMGCKSYVDVQMIAKIRGELIEHFNQVNP